MYQNKKYKGHMKLLINGKEWRPYPEDNDVKEMGLK